MCYRIIAVSMQSRVHRLEQTVLSSNTGLVLFIASKHLTFFLRAFSVCVTVA